MSLTLDDIAIKTRVQEIPSEINLQELRAVTLEERRQSIMHFSERFELGELKNLETPYSLMFGNRRGEVEYFPASGAVWARNTKFEEQFGDEMRKWQDLREEEKDGEIIFQFGERTNRQFIKEAMDFLGNAGLLEGQRQRIYERSGSRTRSICPTR